MIDHIQQNEQIEDVQTDEPTGKPVSADYLGTITTIEGIMDAIGSVLNYVEVVGRALSKTEIAAFRWIEDAYNMEIFERQAERLAGRQADNFLNMVTEFEEMLYPTSAENPQQVKSMRARKQEAAEEKKRAQAEAKRAKELAKAERKRQKEAAKLKEQEAKESAYVKLFSPDASHSDFAQAG